MSSTYKIEKDIPIPPRRGASPFPFLDLEVGDSIEFSVKEWPKARMAAQNFNRIHKGKMHLTCRNRRVWRDT